MSYFRSIIFAHILALVLKMLGYLTNLRFLWQA